MRIGLIIFLLLLLAYETLSDEIIFNFYALICFNHAYTTDRSVGMNRFVGLVIYVWLEVGRYHFVVEHGCQGEYMYYFRPVLTIFWYII